MSAAKVAEYLDAIVTREVVDLVQALVWPVLILGLLVTFRRQHTDCGSEGREFESRRSPF
jgi:uncharacterized membrane protein YecN with MAPEG domain